MLVFGGVIFWLVGKNQVPLAPPPPKKRNSCRSVPYTFLDTIDGTYEANPRKVVVYIIFFFKFSPRSLGRSSNLTISYFSSALVQPPTRKNSCLGYLGHYSTHLCGDYDL